MIGALRENGAVFVEEFCGTVTMEAPGEYGVLELTLREDNHVNTRFSPEEKLLLSVRFSKVSDTRIAGNVLRLLRDLAGRFDVVYIRDDEAGRELDPTGAAWLQKSVTYARYDFEYHIPVRRHNVRCRDVFCLCGGGVPLGAEALL